MGDRDSTAASIGKVMPSPCLLRPGLYGILSSDVKCILQFRIPQSVELLFFSNSLPKWLEVST